MICKNCNKVIPDGNDYCPECGAPMDEPIVISMTKADIKNANKKLKDKTAEKVEKTTKSGSGKPRLEADGPLFNFAGYVKSLKANTASLLSLIGALILFYSPFMTWLWEELWKEKTSVSLFDLGGKNATLALNQPIIIVCAILVLLTAIAMIAISARENIRPLRPYADNILLRFAPAVVAVIILMVIVSNKDYSTACNVISDTIEMAKSIGSSDNYDGGRGAGIIFYIAGTIIYTVSAIMDMGEGNKKNG